jgi:uncharacterized protein YgbK (DUF1537 family)
MTFPMAIIADDLTGAADSAAVFGPVIDAWVALDEGAFPDGDLVAVDTDSRYVSGDRASEVVGAATRNAVGAGARLHKKIDSILRGNIAVEVAAVLDEVDANRTTPAIAVVAPAFPATGRTTVGGVVHVHGEPLSEPRGGDLPSVLEEGGLRTGLAGSETVRSSAVALTLRINELAEQGCRAVVCDAETDEDLQSVQLATALLERPTVLVGSAGLMRVSVYDLAADSGGIFCRADAGGPDLATLVVCGSSTEISHEQIAELVEREGVRAVDVRAPYGPEQRAEALEAARAAFAQRLDPVVVPDRRQLVDPAWSRTVEEAMAEVGGQLLLERGDSLSGAVLTGGATARAVLLRAGVSRLSVKGEVEPGIVLSAVERSDGLSLITKSGSFGDAEALCRCRLTLRGLGPADVSPA